MAQKVRKLLCELPQFDVLGDVLSSLGLKSRLFCRTELGSPWLIQFPRQEIMHFHILERGSAWLELDAKPPARALAPGDVLVIGRGHGYRIGDQPGRRAIEPISFPHEGLEGRYCLIRHGSSEGGTAMICGSFSFESAADHPLLELLPPLMHIKSTSERGTAWVDFVARLLTAEVSHVRPGTQTVVSSLTDILFVEVLRHWMGDGAAAPGWLSALKHPQIGPVLAAVHERPEALWTVEKLARRASLSRSAFSTRFARVVGESAQAYLTRLRMQRATRLLSQEHLSLGRIASAVGYDSEAAFNKAFKRWRGKTPGQLRREQGGRSDSRD
jgi:AraC-like DNA-binding protein